MSKPRVLIVCTGNACRSQMAEGWLRHLSKGSVEAFSAGVAPAGVHPIAVQVMAEAGVDISGHTSKHVREFVPATFDYVVTVCDHAREACPVIPGARRVLHWPFEDPVAFRGPDEVRLAEFRKVRDQIRDRFAAWLAEKPFA